MLGVMLPGRDKLSILKNLRERRNTPPVILVTARSETNERVDESRNREIDGSGLGLSLAREIARAHGGDLVLICSNGEWTSFALMLPLTRENE